ncbi:hypothetical protein E4K65_45160 [Bradyrhizobium niftali]|uniref:Uncharacterized protein n=1 Tax=Bradyrhizobium niftali TaxID=2560055 RepID=A0A4Y9KZN3_9BRAD|nr:hypothetical protein E4K65_45160 [Bradyrhizobium niftali]
MREPSSARLGYAATPPAYTRLPSPCSRTPWSGGKRSEFSAGIRCAIEKGWPELHESGPHVRLLASRRAVSASVKQHYRHPRRQRRAGSNSEIRQCKTHRGFPSETRIYA